MNIEIKTEGMGMSMGFSQEMRQRQEVVQALTFEQRLENSNAILQMRLNLITELQGLEFSIQATCPKCGRVLSPAEVLRGFNRDPQDYNTTCPRCRHRFGAELINKSAASNMSVPFLCPAQTLVALDIRGHLTPGALQKGSPAVFYSAIANFGSIETAFKEAGINYQFAKQLDWKTKVITFLGRLPDTEIARCVSVSTGTIRRLRKANGISPFDSREALNN